MRKHERSGYREGLRVIREGHLTPEGAAGYLAKVPRSVAGDTKGELDWRKGYRQAISEYARKKNPDEDLRALERQAGAGDPLAAARLARERQRRSKKPAKGSPTHTNLFAMWEHFKGRNEAPAHADATSYRHLKRCLSAGLMKPSRDRRSVELTTEGRAVMEAFHRDQLRRTPPGNLVRNYPWAVATPSYMGLPPTTNTRRGKMAKKKAKKFKPRAKKGKARKPAKRSAKKKTTAGLSSAAKKFLRKKVALLVREGRKAKQAVAMAFSFARKKGYRVPPKENPLTRKEARELLAHALYGASQAKKLYRKGLSRKQRQLREARSSGRASAVADFAGEGAKVERKRAQKVVKKLTQRAGFGALRLVRRISRNPLTKTEIRSLIALSQDFVAVANANLRAAAARRKVYGESAGPEGSARQAETEAKFWEGAAEGVRLAAKHVRTRKNPKAIKRAIRVLCLVVKHAKVKRAKAKGKKKDKKTNPAHMLATTALINPNLSDAMEAWARSKRLKVPGRGSVGWKALYTVWAKHDMPRPSVNPKKKSKPKKAAKKKAKKRNPKKSVKRIARFGDLPAALKKKYRPAALLAARRDRIALEDVPITWGKSQAPAPHGLVNQGDLVALEYKLKGIPKRSRFLSDVTYRHASGDHGKGKKKTKAQLVGIDPKTRQTILVSRRGSRPGYSSERGLTG